jgi:hypothetical protein
LRISPGLNHLVASCCTTGREAWLQLSQHFQGSGFVREWELRRKLFRIKCGNSLGAVSDMCSQISVIVSELAIMGEPITDKVAIGVMIEARNTFDEVFAPVSKHTTLYVFLSLVASEDLECHQLDIKTAFLNGVLDETIYMHQPPSFVSSNSKHVCHLQKALYGLHQASLAWHTCLKAELTKHSFVPSQADAGLFIRHGKDLVYVLVYVDDLLIASKHLSDLDHVKQCIMSAFQARDLGNASIFWVCTLYATVQMAHLF